MHDHPFRHIGNAGIDGARGRDVIDLRGWDRLQLAFHFRVGSREIIAGMKVGNAGGAVRHTHGCKDSLPDEILPLLSGDCGNYLAGHHIEQIVVGVLAAKAGLRLDVAELGDDIVARVIGWREEKQVARSESESAAMRQQIADGHLMRYIRVVHLEAGQTVHHAIVPGEFPSSTRIPSEAVVNALVSEPMPNRVYASTPALSPSFRTP